MRDTNRKVRPRPNSPWAGIFRCRKVDAAVFSRASPTKRYTKQTAMKHVLEYSVLPARFAVCRLRWDSALPEWANASTFLSITRTADELSVVCDENCVPKDVRAEGGWACIQLQGPFPFQMTGVLAAILNPLAAAEIGIFAISTFDTDYILVKAEQLQAAKDALSVAGHINIG